MNNYSVIVKQVGIVLILAGILNTGCILYLKVQSQSNSSYSFTLNILAITGGFLLFLETKKPCRKLDLLQHFCSLALLAGYLSYFL